MSGFEKKQFSGVYDFKYSLEGTALKLANINVLQDLQSLQNGSGSSLISLCSARFPVWFILRTAMKPYRIKLPRDMFDKEDYSKGN